MFERVLCKQKYVAKKNGRIFLNCKKARLSTLTYNLILDKCHVEDKSSNDKGLK